MNRRVFLAGAATAGAGLALARSAPAVKQKKEPLYKISLAQWSLHRALKAGELDHLDFARVASEDFGLQAVEYVNSFFKDKAADFDYLAEMKRRAGDLGVRSLLIMIDGEGHLADADDERRRRAIENHFRWVAAARYLGCHSIRVNARGSGPDDEQMARAADSLHRLATVAEPYGINVIVENHGGLSSNGAWLAAVMKKADHPAVGTLPDFGNFRISRDEEYDRYQGVRELMPFARAVSAKSHAFDDAGNEVRTDYRRMMKIVVEAGYRGHVGVEYEGDELSEPDGIRATRSLLERVRAELS